MTSLNEDFNLLLQFAQKRGLMEKEDIFWAANHLINIFRQESFEVTGPDRLPETAAPILTRLTDRAIQMGLIEEGPSQRDLFDTLIMDLVTPRPSEVAARFRTLYQQSPRAATDYFYNLSVAANYVRKSRTDLNHGWLTSTGYGDLSITINVSKPEKDPREIAAAKATPSLDYPACLLCRENEGFFGNLNHPARQNLRLIPLELGGEEWFLQYSPYVYYNEHSIVLSRRHRPMRVDRRAFENLLSFLDFLPHYFIGSNADLPIVGGSILNHDHYQGGRHAFPMDSAPAEKDYDLGPGLSLGRIRWPLSVLRLSGTTAGPLVDAAVKILEGWRVWSDESVNILAESGGERHNTITPIARRQGGRYVLDLVLRNNRTTVEHPFGLFHPHQDVHNIKKENIGLIEVLGLAILPPRLVRELEMLKEALMTGRPEAGPPGLEPHSAWYQEIKKTLSGLSPEETAAGLRREVGLKFLKGLEDAGVFKRDERGQAAFDRFVASVLGPLPASAPR